MVFSNIDAFPNRMEIETNVKRWTFGTATINLAWRKDKVLYLFQLFKEIFMGEYIPLCFYVGEYVIYLFSNI